MTLILAYTRRGITRDITVKNSANAAITAASADKVRVIIGREQAITSDGDTVTGALLTVVSGTPTANGSSLSKNTPSNGTHRLRLDASDLGFAAGVYSLFVDYYDNADSGEWKNVDRQVFSLQE